jgi:hypothetical protein
LGRFFYAARERRFAIVHGAELADQLSANACAFVYVASSVRLPDYSDVISLA